MSELIAAPIPGTTVRILWCCCLGLRGMLLCIPFGQDAYWLCLRCGARADYPRVWDV